MTKQRGSYGDDQLREAVAAGRSLRQVLQALGLVGEGGNYRILKRRM